MSLIFNMALSGGGNGSNSTEMTNINFTNNTYGETLTVPGVSSWPNEYILVYNDSAYTTDNSDKHAIYYVKTKNLKKIYYYTNSVNYTEWREGDLTNYSEGVVSGGFLMGCVGYKFNTGSYCFYYW